MNACNLMVLLLLLAGTILACNNKDQPNKIEEPFWRYLDAGQEAVKHQQCDLAETSYVKAIDELRKAGQLEAGALGSLANVYFLEGKYSESIECRLNKALLDSKDDFERDKNSIWLGQCYLEMGEFDLALNTLQQGQSAARQASKNQNSGNYTVVVNYFDEYIGRYYIYTGSYEKAKEYFSKRMSALSQTRSIAEAQNDLAEAFYYSGDIDAAEALLKKAFESHSNVAVPFPWVLAQSLVMLGRIEANLNHYDKAFQYYNKAYNVLQAYGYADNRIERADVKNQIAIVYLRQRNIENSISAFKDAMSLRRETGTTTHPEYADALKGLADIHALKDEMTSASQQALQALSILDNSVVKTHPRTAPTLVALFSIRAMLKGSGSAVSPSADSLILRLETILQKPLGPWKQDFIATAGFYSGLLRKAGKQTEATQLDELVARQKEK